VTVEAAKKSNPQFRVGTRNPDATDGNLADSTDAFGGGKKKDSGLRLPPEWQRSAAQQHGPGPRPVFPMASGYPGRRYKKQRPSWPTLQKTASIKERGGLNTPCVPVLRANLSMVPAPCDCNTAESESDDREETRLKL